jgi:high mobility group protein 20A
LFLFSDKWYNLAKDEKQPYIDLAKVDKERFKKELKEFKQLNPDDESVKQGEPSKKKIKKDTQSSKTDIIEQPTTSAQAMSSLNNGLSQTSRKDDDVPKTFVGVNCELPIFTESFLEHNKAIESELKMLRKNNIEIEQHNSVLMKHIENMENGVRKVDNEISQERKKNMHLEVYLTKLRCLLASGFNSLSLPNCKDRATVENIDKYLGDLATETARTQNSAISQKARDILKKLDLKSIS